MMNRLYPDTELSADNSSFEGGGLPTTPPKLVRFPRPRRTVGRRIGVIVFAQASKPTGDVTIPADVANAIASETNLTSTVNDIAKTIPKSILSNVNAKRVRGAYELACKLRSQEAEAAAREVMSLFTADGDRE